MEMNLNNPWVYEELAKPENNSYLKDELIDRILALPSDALRQFILNFNLFCNDNACFRIFAWSATLSTSLS